MKKLLKLILPLFFATFCTVQGQTSSPKDSLKIQKHSSFAKKMIIPTGLIAVGLVTNHSDFEKTLQLNLRNKVGNTYRAKIDNYLQYAPIAEMYLADMTGIKAKNHWFDQTKYLLISNLVSYTLSLSLKGTTLKTRPNGEPYSFPSGHSAFAFTNATVLFNEFKDTSPVLAYSGYIFASATGTFRILNNKHWFSDVLVGTGIGILAAQLVYHFEPLKNFNPFIKSKNITLLPQMNPNQYGFYFAYRL